MATPIDSSRPGALPPVAQFLAEAALQRQSSLLGLDKPAPVRAPVPSADPAGSRVPAPSTTPVLPSAPAAAPADKASISDQARSQLGAGFDPRQALPAGGAGAGAAARTSLPMLPPSGAPLAASQAVPATGTAMLTAATWPAEGLDAPVLRMVSAMVAQLTGGGGAPQRVVAAQPWPVGLAHALEKGDAEPGQPPLQTWLVRQGTVQTPDGPRGFALTLRMPVPWMASQSAPSAAVAPPPSAPLQIPFSGYAQALQSGVFALVLQGPEAGAASTSALLVLDFQAQLPASVYGRDMLLPQAQRLDPWTQMAVLQASGHLPTEEARERDRPLCEVSGCPYAGRSPCAQPFCLALRWVDPVVPVLPAGPGA
ncbi:MAG: hypothetical protein V4679_08150 [Pseudomonadota bacterium]